MLDSCSVICTVPALAAFVVLRAPCVAFPDWAISVSDGYDLPVYSKYAVIMLETVAAVPQFTFIQPWFPLGIEKIVVQVELFKVAVLYCLRTKTSFRVPRGVKISSV